MGGEARGAYTAAEAHGITSNIHLRPHRVLCEDPQRGTSGKHCSRLHIYTDITVYSAGQKPETGTEIYMRVRASSYIHTSLIRYKEVGLYLSTLAYLLT